MINVTQIRKVFKLCCFDPKKTKHGATEWHICARDMEHFAHILRAKQLLSMYIEGAKGVSVVFDAIWHLACGMAKYDEGVYIQKQQAARVSATTEDNPDVETSGLDSKGYARQ